MRRQGIQDGMIGGKGGVEPEANARDLGAVGARRFGRYVLIKKLATGGMAEIWLATQVGIAGFTRFMVIKKILSHLSEHETFVHMFLDEARTSAQLTHPNIVQIYDLGQIAGSYYIAMEYIAGENLSAISWRATSTNTPITPAFAARVICDAAKALHYAHQLRGSDGRPLEIVHRDVSPQNILVTYEGEVKVVDFGIAKAATKSEHTRTGMLKGKFSYMSPEQCTGAPLDGRSDVFALGIVLYELCTGMRLFKHESELMILEMITSRSVVRPSEVVPTVPPELDAIIMRALEKSVDQRYQSAQEMQIALDEFLRKQPKALTSGDIGNVMRSLFAQDLEEKRRLIEAASKNQIPIEPDEALDRPQASQPALPHPGQGNGATYGGRHSGQNGGTHPGAPVAHPHAAPATFPGMPQVWSNGGQVPPGMLNHPGMTPMGAFVAYPPGSRAAPGWLVPVLLTFALAVLGTAGWILLASGPARPLPTRRGSVTLATRPIGAKVYLDGRLVAGKDGAALLTPLVLGELELGSTHGVRFELEGYKSLERSISMGDAINGQTLESQLVASAGEIAVAVVGDDAPDLYFGAERVGSGPRFRTTLPAGQTVAVSAVLEGRECTAVPSSVDVRPGKSTSVSVRCTRKSRGALARGERAVGAEGMPEKSTPEKGTSDGAAPAKAETDKVERRKNDAARSEEAADRCTSNPDLPKGYVTIDTNPYSEIFVAGRKIGETPLARFALPAGCTEFLAVSPSTGQKKRFRLETQPGSHQIYKIDL